MLDNLYNEQMMNLDLESENLIGSFSLEQRDIEAIWFFTEEVPARLRSGHPPLHLSLKIKIYEVSEAEKEYWSGGKRMAGVFYPVTKKEE